ncbi:MAG: hypothetical protein Q4A31_05065 [Corynebacterium sp.]|nr:hypothetical protein [Corynebacterium sp.]MDO4761268.1 hypothetical protein [Corynebacterium sp.]
MNQESKLWGKEKPHKLSPLMLIIGALVVLIGLAIGAQLGTELAHLILD